MTEAFSAFTQKENIDYDTLSFRSFNAKMTPNQMSGEQPLIEFTLEARTPEGRGVMATVPGSDGYLVAYCPTEIHKRVAEWLIRMIKEYRADDEEEE